MAKRPSSERIEPNFEKSGKKSARSNQSNTGKTKKSAPPQRRKKPQNKRKRGGFWFFKKTVYWSVVLGLWGCIAIVGIIGYYAATLPQSSSWKIPSRPPNAKIMSSDGELLANRGLTGGASIRLNEMSPYIPMAVIAIEDRRFKSHFGFDPIGFTRAMVANITSGRLVQGGSTLTQQLAKNLFLKPKRTLERKVQELILSVWLETKFTKGEIMELYLNRVYFGSNAYGVDAASRRYFSKPASEVNLAEAALLAGLLKAPSKLSPAKNPKLAEARAQVVLGAMRRSGFINAKEAKKAMTMQPKKAKRFWSGPEHYAADLVMKELPKLIGELNDDVIIETTVNMAMQQTAGAVISNTLNEVGEARKVSQGALVSMTPNGEILALVGGREYSESQFNRAVDAKRQPGSAFKPIVYLAAMEAGRTPVSIRQDAPVRIGKWTPVNYDRKYRGPVTLDTALTKSLNTIAAQMVVEVGPRTVIETAKRLGIQSQLQNNASIALGTSEVSLLELTRAYAPFANGGEGVTPHIIRKITTKEGKVLYEYTQQPIPTVVRSRELGMMNYMLRHVVTHGTGKAASLGGREIAGKTGTTQNSRDGLFVGYSANMITGVWYGNDDGSPTRKVTGGSLPAKTFKSFMTSTHENYTLTPLPGHYEPEPQIAVSTQTELNGTQGQIGENGTMNDGLSQERPQRRPLSEINQNANKPRKSKTILDLIFGG